MLFFKEFDKSIIFDRLKRINFNLIFLVFLIFGIGITMLYSAGGGNWQPWASKQLIYFICFFPITILIATIDINFWFKTSYLIYFFGLCLLIFVEIIGHKSMGATRWVRIGFINFQPSELMKICLILSLAKYFFVKDLDEIKENKNLIIPIMLFILPFVLILKQPNLGTALILMIITISIFFSSGVQIWKFALCIVLVLLSSPIVWKFGIKDYQKQRIMTFLNPTADPLKSGYNIAQSKIAIGSGGLSGKGFLNGTQGQLEFLPEKQTDFIFTIFAEEFGFIGTIFLIFLYLCLFGILFFMCTKSNNNFCRIIIIGIFINLFSHFFINIGMIIGLLPVVGTPLPLMSYGGSITVSTLISLGFVLNADINRNIQIKNR